MSNKIISRELRKTKLNFIDLVKRDYAYLVMMAIPAAYFIIFHYVPMYGVIIAFQDYKIGSDFFAGAKWVGFRWFIEFFNSPLTIRVFWNTVILSVQSIVILFPLPIILALVFNEVKNRYIKGFAQTASYMPYFISIAVVVGILYNFLSINGGIINQLLASMGIEPINFMDKPSWFRPLYIITEAWQGVGFSSIIYIAAIAGISPTLYEAANVDGSTRLKNIMYITIPSIIPTIVILFILRLGSIMSVGFEKVLLMQKPITYETSDVISTLVYRSGLQSQRFSYATAIDLFNSMINIAMLLIANYISKKVSETSLW